MNTINQPQTNGKIRLDYIDALRGIAALMVLICHSLQVDPSLVLPPALVQTFESGKYGVQLFFVISALTIFYSLFNGDPNTINFLIRRFFRIAPLYFVAVAFYSWLFGAGADGIGLNLAFLHGFSPRYINSVVPGGWSIGIEMVFYCMIPFLFRKLFNLKRALYFFLATVVFSFICMYVYRKLFTSTSDLESFVYFWLPNHLPVFALGFITYYLSFEKTLPNIKSLFSPLVLLCLVVSAGILTKLSLVGEHVVFAITAAVFIFLLSKKALPGLVNKTTLYLGKISYSLYLTQYAAIAILIKTGCFSLFPGNSSTTAFPNLLLNLVFLFITTVLLSTILYYGIEQPFQTLGKKLLRHRTKLNNPAALRATVKRMPSAPIVLDTEKK